jgi:hypothetical protein
MIYNCPVCRMPIELGAPFTTDRTGRRHHLHCNKNTVVKFPWGNRKV